MARPVDTDRRRVLLEAAATYLVEHGIAGVSLEDIARAAGTSSRMLVHHFGTRDSLIAGALEIARSRQLEAARPWFAPGPDAVAVLESTWPWFVAPETGKYFRLFQQVAALERLQPPAMSEGLSTRLGTDWKPILLDVFAADPRYLDNALILTNLTVALYRGLAIDLPADANDPHLRHAFECFAVLLRTMAI